MEERLLFLVEGHNDKTFLLGLLLELGFDKNAVKVFDLSEAIKKDHFGKETGELREFFRSTYPRRVLIKIEGGRDKLDKIVGKYATHPHTSMGMMVESLLKTSKGNVRPKVIIVRDSDWKDPGSILHKIFEKTKGIHLKPDDVYELLKDAPNYSWYRMRDRKEINFIFLKPSYEHLYERKMLSEVEEFFKDLILNPD